MKNSSKTKPNKKSEKSAKQKNSAKKKPQAKKRISHLVKPQDMSLEEWQIALRKQIAEDEHFDISCVDRKLKPGKYSVENPKTRSAYKVVFRGKDSPWNYCSCMDFKASQLGTCKHVEAVRLWISNGRKVCKDIPPYTSVYLNYRKERKVCIRIGSDNHEAYCKLAAKYFDKDCVLKENALENFEVFLKKAYAISNDFRCYKDALAFIDSKRDGEKRKNIISGYSDNSLDSILKVKLFPYQKEGVRFAFAAGKSIIADEMGLGKTIQAIATAELMRKEGLIESALIAWPTSLKYQWKREIERFAKNAKVHVIEGDHLKRRDQYNADAAYKIISYNSACNDVKIMGSLQTELLIMDEVQRLKNWDTQLSRYARRIESQYSVILSGTPLENKLEELFSIVEFVDQFALAPYYLFRDEHVQTDDTGRIVGYRNLNRISEKLKDVMIRRRKKDVKLQMPARTDKNIFVPMTKEQMDIHEGYKGQLAKLIQRWKVMHFLSEQDRRKLLTTLNKMRMVCDSTFILDQKTRYDTKIAELMCILDALLSTDEKVVVFSQWERMTRLVAKELQKRDVKYSYLFGGIPSAKRKDLVNDFTDNPDVRVFLSTDAGSTGLNLQAASTIINLDLPWNPAVLEQRVARIYRLGQQNSVQVLNLIAPESIEENMIGKLKFKLSLFEGALDGGEDAVFLDTNKFSKLVEALGEFTDGTSNENAQEDSAISVVDEAEQPADPSVPSDAADILPLETQDDVPEFASDGVQNPAQTVPQSTAAAQSTIASTNTPDDVIGSGLAFFAKLATSLKTEEGKTQLMERLVKTDKQTGATSINIPVPHRDVVKQLLDVVGKLLGG